MSPDFNFSQFDFILASGSPRRRMLLKELGISFETRDLNVDESFPLDLEGKAIPLYLCRKKALAFAEPFTDKTLLITADTVVWIDNMVLNKPVNKEDAKRMLTLLSGKVHSVFTGVCLRSKNKIESFCDETKVYFKPLSEAEIDFYVNAFNPMDKAGAYGAQEWIGYIGIERIEGTYFNVMGLPVNVLYEALKGF